MDAAPLILTLALDNASQQFLDELREKYFPPERNFLRAHCTFFHALPGAGEEQIVTTVREVLESVSSFTMHIGAPRFIGRGVAIPLEGKEAPTVHARLQKRWWDTLTQQDRQGLWPHVTVQNKVSPEEARNTHTLLLDTFTPRTVTAVGLQLWRYLGGPWGPMEFFPFRSESNDA